MIRAAIIAAGFFLLPLDATMAQDFTAEQRAACKKVVDAQKK